jgi:hypothetical protein
VQEASLAALQSRDSLIFGLARRPRDDDGDRQAIHRPILQYHRNIEEDMPLIRTLRSIMAWYCTGKINAEV